MLIRSVYTKSRRRRRVNAAMILAILFSLKTMETNRVTPERVTNLFWSDCIDFNEICIAIVLSQYSLCVDVDVRCKNGSLCFTYKKVTT